MSHPSATFIGENKDTRLTMFQSMYTYPAGIPELTSATLMICDSKDTDQEQIYTRHVQDKIAGLFRSCIPLGTNMESSAALAIVLVPLIPFEVSKKLRDVTHVPDGIRRAMLHQAPWMPNNASNSFAKKVMRLTAGQYIKATDLGPYIITRGNVLYQCPEMTELGRFKRVALAAKCLIERCDEIGPDLEEYGSRLRSQEADGASAQNLGATFLIASELEAYNDQNWARHSRAIKLKHFATPRSRAPRTALADYCSRRIAGGAQEITGSPTDNAAEPMTRPQMLVEDVLTVGRRMDSPDEPA
eukprot:g94.t1